MAAGKEIDELALLTLLSVPRIGSGRIRNLISRFGTPEAVLRASPRSLIEVEGIEKNLALQIKNNTDIEFAKAQLNKARGAGATIVTYWDERYPRLLKTTFDPPVMLFVKGEAVSLNDISVAVVGTRQPSDYGKISTQKMTGEIAAAGVAIISGLARGVDTIAHTEALNSGGKTIAVLGTGVDVIYPPENKKLAERIIDDGAIISEFMMGEGPDAMHFPRRNRIISGMSKATLIIEAGLKSGALITADFALDQGRDVFVVPGQINNPRCAGSNLLIQQGAQIVLKAADILNLLKVDASRKQPIKVELSKEEEMVYQLLSSEPQHIDQIAASLQKPTANVLAVLLSLELKNVVHQMPGKMFART